MNVSRGYNQESSSEDATSATLQDLSQALATGLRKI